MIAPNWQDIAKLPAAFNHSAVKSGARNEYIKYIFGNASSNIYYGTINLMFDLVMMESK